MSYFEEDHMRCSQCKGNMFLEDAVDEGAPAAPRIQLWHCLQCSRRTDSGIEANKKLTPEELRKCAYPDSFDEMRKLPIPIEIIELPMRRMNRQDFEALYGANSN